MPTSMQLLAAGLFALAVLHTFSTKVFERLARAQPAHAGLWHLLGEVEVVFGFWALVLMLVMFAVDGSEQATAYIDSRNFTEPLFVFVIMVIAATRPILTLATYAVRAASRIAPLPGNMGFLFAVLAVVPLLGSFITEPAAMTLAALILRDRFYSQALSARLKYAIIGVLFVNVSIGGTLTPFAAPPVLMVAAKWNWDLSYMLLNIGWKAAVAVVINSLGLVLLFRKKLLELQSAAGALGGESVSWPLLALHVLFLASVVVFAHHPAIFMGLFLFFLGVVHAYGGGQERLILREGLLVAFFLAGLVVLGGMQQWWLQPLLVGMGNNTVFVGATALTAITDNAALTYLGSLVEGLTDEFKYALVTGAVTGGGLTIIANAPNPAGISILRSGFQDETVHPLGLLAAAAIPTLIGGLAFHFL